MPKSLLEQLPEIVAKGRQQAEKILESLESRHRCCQVRKLEPLARAMSTLDVWVCGLRHGQSVTRKDMQTVEWDSMHRKIKVNPLIDWSEDDVWSYIRQHHVPYNKLHDQGFPSIGCEPCTRAIAVGEDFRAGRWWWENEDAKECGLHVAKNPEESPA